MKKGIRGIKAIVKIISVILWVLVNAIIGKGVHLTNVKINGVSLSHNEYQERLIKKNQPLLLDTDQGKTLFVHGTGIRDMYETDQGWCGSQELVKRFNLSGKVNLISCFNKLNGAEENEDVEFVKDSRINTEYMIIAIVYAGNIFAYSSEWAQKEFCKAQSELAVLQF